ncbi:MAG: ribosome maturation factor RimP [Bacteroidia bacterium]|jgi:ribosome maturation factor RimP
MTLVETIKSLVEEELKDSLFFLVDVVGGDRSRKIQVLIDGDNGVSVDQCSRISRAVSKVVDEESFEADPFILEVSSPGADEPLKTLRQYNKHIGRTLKVETSEGTTKYKLLEVTSDSIVGEPELDKKQKKKNISVEPATIGFSNILTSTVVLSFK